jgi:hypothetical protein
MNNLLDAPCVFCDYNGRGYWQKETHSKHCPFYTIGGISDRQRELRGIVKVRSEVYNFMFHSGSSWLSKLYRES